jgi:hypothetical protein
MMIQNLPIVPLTGHFLAPPFSGFGCNEGAIVAQLLAPR